MDTVISVADDIAVAGDKVTRAANKVDVAIDKVSQVMLKMKGKIMAAAMFLAMVWYYMYYTQ